MLVAEDFFDRLEQLQFASSDARSTNVYVGRANERMGGWGLSLDYQRNIFAPFFLSLN